MAKQKSHFYKGKYLIALYDFSGWPVAVFDNCEEMALKMGRSEKAIQSLLSQYNSHSIKFIEYFGIKTTIHFPRVRSKKQEKEETQNGISSR